MKLYVFTKKDIDRFLIECNFTPDEEKLFRLRCQITTGAILMPDGANITSEGITAVLMGETLMTTI